MAKAPEAEPVKDQADGGQQDATLNDRVSSLEAGQHSLADRVEHIISMLGGGGDHDADSSDPEPRGGNPAGIAHEIRAQLDEARARDAAKVKEDGRDSALAELRQQVAELRETPPADPPKRRHKIMGWT